MSLKKSFILGAGAFALASSFSAPVLAGATEGLAGCKSVIEGDAQLSAYNRIDARMDTMKRRGRYTHFTLDVYAKHEDGSREEWTAQCKARSSGKVEELQLTRVGQPNEPQVAVS